MFKIANRYKFLFEVLIWIIPTLSFLLLYVQTSNEILYSWPKIFLVHFKIIGSVFGLTLAIKLLHAQVFSLRFLNSSKKAKYFSQLLISIFIGSLLFSLWLYYAVVLIGIHFWGFVTSYEVLVGYAGKINEFGLVWLTPFKSKLLYLSGCALISIMYYFTFNKINWLKFFIKDKKINIAANFLIVCLLTYNFYFVINNFMPYDLEPISKNLNERKTYLLKKWMADNHIVLSNQKGSALVLNHDIEGHLIDDNVAKKMDDLAQNERKILFPQYQNNKQDRPNLVYIVVDALRADHVQLYNYERPTTPNLQKLFTQGKVRVIQNVHSTCGDTACGLLSMFSSKYAPQFSFSPITLHEVLRNNGYKINLILSGDHSKFYDLSRYYANADDFYDGFVAEDKGYQTNDDQLVIDHLKTYPNWDGKPVFFQFHLMSSHLMRANKYYTGPYNPFLSYLTIYSQGSENAPLWHNFYDNGVWHSDDFIHQIIDLLQDKGYLKNTLVVITADHGDGMGEHGIFGHSNSVYEEFIHIPFILIDFNHKPHFFEQKNQYPGQVDMAPTILSELNIKAPSTWYGKSIGEGGNSISHFEERQNTGLIDKTSLPGVWKYWFNPNEKDKAFNLSNDPQEKNNLIDTLPTNLVNQWKTCATNKNDAPSLKDCVENEQNFTLSQNQTPVKKLELYAMLISPKEKISYTSEKFLKLKKVFQEIAKKDNIMDAVYIDHTVLIQASLSPKAIDDLKATNLFRISSNQTANLD